MFNTLASVNLITLPYDIADNGDLVVMEGLIHVPFSIKRVFVVRGFEGAVRGQHAHKTCSQFLTCPYGSVEVLCNDASDELLITLDRPEVGLLIPPSIWAKQTYLKDNSVLTVLCDKPYDAKDYIRNFDEYKLYLSTNTNS